LLFKRRASQIVMPFMSRDRTVPLIVAVALFMENMDSTVIATSLPAIAADIGANPLALKLAITSYLLSLAVFIPASGWTADRFGARTVFRAAIAVFVIGSIGCAISGSLTDFVIARIVQGMGGAMMTPVGRMVLVRSISKRDLVNAMAWVTTPALIGPVMGPPVGGFITTYASWHWIFLINVPIGILGIILATRYIDDMRAAEHERFDVRGMLLAGLGIAGLAFGLSVAGLNFLPWPVVAALIVAGAIFTTAYLLHARRTPQPALDLTLFRLPTFRVSVLGGFLFRLGLGALPFLLPLMLQVGFGMTPFQSGLITFATALGSISMKIATATILRRLGFKTVLVVNTVISAAFLAACAGFTIATPAAVMVAILLVGGFFRSLQFTSINTIAYAEIEPARVGKATALVAVGQQLSIAAGVALGAFAVEATVVWRGHAAIEAADFQPAFIVVALVSVCAALVFSRLAPDAGAEMANRLPNPAGNPAEVRDQRIN
jgi:EmrB/QacA subfamily drug resistance transporter